MMLEDKMVVNLEGIVTGRRHEGGVSGIFSFLICALTTWVRSMYEKSLACRVLIRELFYIYIKL